jgi:acetyl-CoA synthetase
MSESKIYKVPETFAKQAHLDAEQFQQMYRESVDDPAGFWAKQAQKFLSWEKPWDKVLEWDFNKADIRWFEGGKLNACYNCIDRHLERRAEQTALIWEGDDPADDDHISYGELYEHVCRLANVLMDRNVGKGDRVCIYMPMIPEAVYAMLACARIGAIHSVVFGGFSPESIKDRILDSDCQTVITADEGMRGGKVIPLKANVDQALQSCPNVHTVLTVRRTAGKIDWQEGRDVWYHDAIASVGAECPVEWMDAEDPLFILYTSGSTGKPKGVHSYIVYGPLANGAVSLVFEGVPTYPDASRFWQVCDKHKVNTFYTAPTALRALMRMGDGPVNKTSRDSLRLLGTVGEPINPEAWEWYYHTIGSARCPIVDTWWQTETGGHMITPVPGAMPMKPGSAALPFFGVQPAIVDNDGNILEGEAEGNLVITHPWPAQIRTVYGNHQRLIDTYFTRFPGMYFTGDGARRDADGFYWITGRVDDVLIVSGHNLGTAELESALVLHKAVAEAAIVGYPHDIKGQGIYAYVTLIEGVEPSDELRQELINQVRQEIGPIATPDIIQWAPGLPKTRSGKIMRRILRKIAANEADQIGDTSTLADPAVVEDLVANRINNE